MGRILYECHFNPMMLIPLIIPIGVLLISAKHDNQKRGYSINTKAIKVICWCFILVVLLMLIDIYKKTVIAYQNDDYQIIEGYVENFDTMPYGGRKYETFEIDGVKFGYSDFSIMIGYHNSKSHGGVIRRDGQYLKIGYVRYGNENIIVYIEEYSEKSYSGNES